METSIIFIKVVLIFSVYMGQYRGGQIMQQRIVTQRQGVYDCRGQAVNVTAMNKYRSTVTQYQQFLESLQHKLQNVYQKQCYRIYLNGRTNERQYKQLIQQKDELIRALQDSNGYRQSANRGLIQQIMSLEDTYQEYKGRNNEYDGRIHSKKKQILKKKKQLKVLQTQIKSYWVYNYDVTTLDISGSCCIPKRLTRNNSYAGKSKQAMDKGRNAQHQVEGQNEKPRGDLNDSSTAAIKDNSIRLPSLRTHAGYVSSARCPKYSDNCPNQNYTFISKDLSLLSSSKTKQKILKRICDSNQRRVSQKLQYQREKVNLLKIFKIYLNKSQDSQQNLNQRVGLKKIVIQLQEQIKAKQQKLNLIQQIINQ